MIQAHVDAVLALLTASPLGSNVHDGKVPNGTDVNTSPYVLVRWSDDDLEDTDSRPLTGASERFLLRIFCYCVGGNQNAARAVSQRVRTALLDVKPVVSGRTCSPIRSEEGGQDEPDENTGASAWERLKIYRLESVPG